MPSRVALIAALAVAYVVTARLGLAMDAVAGFATLVWAPSGIALAALVRGGRGLWPGVFVGALVANLWVGAPPLVAAAIATGNTLEAVVAASALSRAGFDPSFARVRDAAALVAFAAIGSTAVSASVGVAALHAAGIVSRGGLGATWAAWWVGDAIGDLVVASLLLAWSTPLAAGPDRARVLEGAIVLAVTLAIGWVVFGRAGSGLGVHALFAPLAWAAVRLRPRGSTLTVLVVSACAVAGTAFGLGPFALRPLHTGLLDLQAFMGVVAAVTLLVAAAVAERDEARAVAEAALKGRDEFLAIASHELRSPLSALTLQLGTMHHRFAKGEPPSVEQLDRAARQTDRLSQLVTRLLDVSRVEVGQLRIEPEPFDLAELLREVVERSAEEAKRSGNELRLSAPAPVHGAWDRMRLEQVIANLLSNAFRHAAGAPVELLLTADGRWARLVVRDHGAGVSKSDIARLFQRYRRVGARERGGLGLGLYISRHVVEAHGGKLRAESPPGSGLELVVELPLRRGDRPAGGAVDASPRGE